MSDSAGPLGVNGLEIAVIGMAGRFPGAETIEAFWRNLQSGVESVSFFSDEELTAAGLPPAALKDPHYVRAGAVLDKIEWLDAAFFGLSPREAELMDPQHRLFLECAWEALERAGYIAERNRGEIGVNAGVGTNTYLLNNLLRSPYLRAAIGAPEIALGNEKDFLATRVSYKLGLEGPGVIVQTACSTSLVAVHLACQGLLSGECDMALAGGVSIRVPHKFGYPYQEGGVASPDGHCRAFDADARGTLHGNGIGIVVLKRLADALADGDCIDAIIKGSAINNDGALKVGYMAPGQDGQARVIRAAQLMSEVAPETITYVEAHGTGTPMGDPIEIAALTQAFRTQTQKRGFCAIGSVKTNIGHLDAAAGVASLIKTVLALKQRRIPASLNFSQPNPKIDFAASPFYVNTALAEWKSDGRPRRAGVSSFGIGGTNAHVVLEEAPAVETTRASRPYQLLLLSAKTSPALEAMTSHLAEHLNQHPEIPLADAAYTLQVGRKVFNHRRFVVGRDLDSAVTALAALPPGQALSSVPEAGRRPIAFLFPGQGAQYVHMGRELFETEPVFRRHVDHCLALLEPHMAVDLRQVLYPDPAGEAQARELLKQTAFTQPALFVVEYALAQLWWSWGIRPDAMVGHSIGEYTAACLAGVMSLEDALGLVALRGRLIQGLPGGAMLSVPLSENELQPLLDPHLSLAAINGPALCTVAGPVEAVEALDRQLAAQKIACHRLTASHAFHSPMMEPVLDQFAQAAGSLRLHPPQLAYISSVTGTWITAAEATDPYYWARQLRYPVRFADSLQALLQDVDPILVEAGPGRTLCTLAALQPQTARTPVRVPSMRHPQESTSDVAFMLTALGRLWLAGVDVDWPGFYADERRRRVLLPTYPFERQHYWVEPQSNALPLDQVSSPAQPRTMADWFYRSSWKQSALSQQTLPEQPLCWLLLMDSCGVGSTLAQQLESQDQDVVRVRAGEQFARIGPRDYTIRPHNSADYRTLLQELGARRLAPQKVAHLWSLAPVNDLSPTVGLFAARQGSGFYSVLFLAQALDSLNRSAPVEVNVVTNCLHDLTGSEVACPEKATLLAACKVIPQESPKITCRSIEIILAEPGSWQAQRLGDQLLGELAAAPTETVVAYRGASRWIQTFDPIRSDVAPGAGPGLREGGVYLITGGLGTIGSAVADYLARNLRARLALLGRSTFPAREAWAQWLATHGPDDDLSQKIGRILALEALGAEVLIISADVASEAQMHDALAQIDQRFGALHGVIHAAGLTGEESLHAFQETDVTACEEHFEPKVYGAYVLEGVLRERRLDFCLLLSSLASVLGGIGFTAYAAANLVMDAFARRQRQRAATPWVSLNLDGWQLMNETQTDATATDASAPGDLVPASSGVEVLRRALSLSSECQVIVSTRDLPSRVDRWLGLTSRSGPALPAAEGLPVRHARPALRTDYVAPANGTQQAIVEIWQEMLGVEPIGIHDNFFDLGGQSLLATRIVSRIRDVLQAELPLRSIFEKPTVANLAEAAGRQPVESDSPEPGRIQKRRRGHRTLDELVRTVKNLSPDEARALLGAESLPEHSPPSVEERA